MAGQQAAVLNQVDEYFQRALTAVRSVPHSTWRALIIAVSLLWVAHNLAKLIWVVFAAPTLPTPPVVAVPQTVAKTATAKSYSIDLDALKSQHVFGKNTVSDEALADSQQAIQTDVPDDAAKTSLNLKLVGLLASSVEDEAFAVIANGNKQDTFQIGDKLPAGQNVTLAKVLFDRVIIRNNGRAESLWLYTDSDLKVTLNNKSRNRPVARNTAPQQAPLQRKISPSEVPKSISDIVRFSVHREDGQMVGFRIRPGKNRELFERLGLKANDVVTSVNGIAIDNAEAIRNNYQQLKSASVADLQIRRGEELIYITVSLDTSE